MQALHQYLVLLLFIAITLIPSFIIGMSTSQSISTWYVNLKKPSWNPPNWIFGPVWTVLYISMSVAAWLVWCEDSSAFALRLYVFQLLLNQAWSPTFFLLKRPKWAFVLIALLWLSIVLTTIAFWFKVVLAAKLMLPYLAWVSFAACLNYLIWKDNT